MIRILLSALLAVPSIYCSEKQITTTKHKRNSTETISIAIDPENPSVNNITIEKTDAASNSSSKKKSCCSQRVQLALVSSLAGITTAAITAAVTLTSYQCDNQPQ